MPAGRPRANLMAVLIRTVLTLREGEDDDLITAFRSVPPRKRAAFIKAAMRSGGLQINVDGLPDDSELADSLENFLA
jgi:hypothetical protein